MKYWYADDSEFYSQTIYKHPDVFVFGGIVVDEKQLLILRERIESVKSKYTQGRAPVKWNMRDLKETYEKVNSLGVHKMLVDRSQEIRKDIILAVNDIDYKIIVSAIESYCDDPKKLKEKKSELSSYCFAMGLMRFGLEMSTSEGSAQVILDWPDKEDSTVFNNEYAKAFNRGKSISGVNYHSGPLSKIGFNDSINFTSMKHSTAMQLADIVVGATKDFLQTFSKPQKNSSFKKEIFEMILPKFRGAPDPFGRGLIISTNSRNLHESVKDVFVGNFPTRKAV